MALFLAAAGKAMAVVVSTGTVFEAGTPKVLFQAPPQPTFKFGDYTVDGKRFLFPLSRAGDAAGTLHRRAELAGRVEEMSFHD
jgi:hypothetical protein